MIWAIVVAYSGPYGEKGTVLSRHATAELAERALRRYSSGGSGFLAIREIEK
jgi:hypothetical protein